MNTIIMCLHGTFGKRAGLSTKIVEEPIAPFQLQKLVGHDALERWAQYSVFCRPLRDGPDEQIDIVHSLVQQLETLNNL